MDIVEIILLIAVALGFGFLFKKEQGNEKETKKLKEEVAQHRSAIEGGRRRVGDLATDRATTKEEIDEKVSNLDAGAVADRYRQRNRPDYDEDLR